MDYTNDNGKNPISSSIMQDDDNLSLSAWINSELRRRQSEKLPIQNDWIENINFYSGIQYNNQGYNDYTFRFMNNNDDKVVYNRIRKIGEALKASINTGIRVPVATPISSSDIDIRNAKISTDVINHVMRQNSMEKQMSKIGEDLTVYGNCFWKDTWDINAGRTLREVIKGYQKEREMLPKEFVEQMDLWIQENMDMREGDISIKRISPFSIYPDNINRECLDDVNSIIVSEAYDIGVASFIYGVDFKKLNVKVETISSVTKQGGHNQYGNTSKNSNSIITNISNQLIVNEFYERPNNKFPNGRFIIQAGDVIVHDGDLPFKNGSKNHKFKERDFPFTHMHTDNTPNVFFKDSLIYDIKPLQRRLNALRNLMAEYIKKSTHQQWSAEDGSLINKITNKPGSIIWHRKGSAPPRLVESKSMPNDNWTELYSLDKELVDSTNLNRQNIHGESGTQIRSAKMQEAAKQQGETNMVGIRKNITLGMVRIGEHIIRHYKEFLAKGEVRHLQYSKNMDDHIDFTSDLLTDSILIESQSQIMQTPEARKEKIAETQVAINNQKMMGINDIESHLKMSDAIGMGVDDATMLIPGKVHFDRATHENRQIKDGIMPVLDADDNSSIHLEAHVNYKLGTFRQRFQTLVGKGDINKALQEAEVLDQHIKQHKEIVQKQQEMAAMQASIMNQKKA